jgi:hypothetical protein
MEACGGGSVDDFMGANIYINTPLSFDTTFDIRVDYVPIGNSCGGATSSEYFSVTILAGQYGGSTNPCSGGPYYPSGANICSACVISGDSSVNWTPFSC